MTGSYISEHVTGVVDIAFGRDEGLDRLDLTVEGFYRSFVVVIVTLAIYAVVALADLSALNSASGAEPWSRPAYLAATFLISLVGLIASLLVLFLLCRTAHTQSRFSIAVIAGNWFAAITVLPILPIYAFAAMSGEESNAAGLLSMVLLGWVILTLVGYWRVIRISLQISNSETLLFFVVPISAQLVLEYWLMSTIGLPW